jgi:hypothetical protein
VSDKPNPKQQLTSAEASAARAKAATERRKHHTEVIVLEVNAKVQQIDKPGRTIEETEEFYYLFKGTVTQPFTESYFENIKDRVRFYTGLSGSDVLKVAFGFVSLSLLEEVKHLYFKSS